MNNNEEPTDRFSPSKIDLLSKGESTIMSVCQSLSNSLDLFIAGKSQIVPKNEVCNNMRRHSHQVTESSEISHSFLKYHSPASLLFSSKLLEQALSSPFLS